LKQAAAIVALLACLLPLAGLGGRNRHGDARFEAVDVFVNAGNTPLAAYQVEVKASAGRVKVVGVEGGEPKVFAAPPYYDPKAMQNERVIVGAFSTAAELPTGRIRVARVHVMVEAGEEAAYAVTLMTAGNSAGQRIDATATVEKH